MARSRWKFFFYKKFEVEKYVNYFLDEYVEATDINYKRFSTIHYFNFFLPVKIHFGKLSIFKSFSKYYIGWKLGSFTKTKKPFYFRSKKKRYVNNK